MNSTRYDSKTASLKYANVFNLANIIMNGSAGLDQKIDARRQLQSLFATAQLGYNEFVYLDLSARNDWSSTLAYTSHEKSGFFYPSVGFSLIFNKLMTLPQWVSLAKIRGHTAWWAMIFPCSSQILPRISRRVESSWQVMPRRSRIWNRR